MRQAIEKGAIAMIAQAQKLTRLSEVIEVPSEQATEGVEVNAKDIANVDVVITDVTLQWGRGKAKGTIVGARFNILRAITDEVLENGTIFEDGEPALLITRNEMMVQQAKALVEKDTFPLLATLTKAGRSYYWS